MTAAITLNVTNGRDTETWKIDNRKNDVEFTHNPANVYGLGSTKDGETFSGDCWVSTHSELRSWQSLVITEDPAGERPGPYAHVYWYIKAPGDTSSDGTWVETDAGDGEETHATMTYSFVDEDGELKEEAGFYEITAYVYRWDQSVYWESYTVWVEDR